MRIWQRFIERLFRIFFITADVLTRFIYWLTKGSLGHHQAGYDILLLTTTGRRSGKSRTHALLYLMVGDNWVVIGSNGGNLKHPSWYFNLLDQPQAKIQVGMARHLVMACLASGAERSALWEQLLKVWPAYANYQAGIQREIPIVVLKPIRLSRSNGSRALQRFFGK
jgi:deazaflavin-dependent oxidoreductase (nitroreductase family)